jgi:hypothetical protein
MGRAQPDPLPIPFRKTACIRRSQFPEIKRIAIGQARSSGGKAGPDDCRYQCRRNRSLIAETPKVFLRTAECVARKRDRFSGIISKSSSEAVDDGIITRNYAIET